MLVSTCAGMCVLCRHVYACAGMCIRVQAGVCVCRHVCACAGMCVRVQAHTFNTAEIRLILFASALYLLIWREDCQFYDSKSSHS